MDKDNKQKNIKENILYNNILLISRNKLFYTHFNLDDTFQNRINLIFIHISFLFIKIKQKKESKVHKLFYQRLFDYLFRQIDINMREIGYGDVMVNKNMKFLIKSFYDILLFCENYDKKKAESKKNFFKRYLLPNINANTVNIIPLNEHFNKFQSFCFDLDPDSVLQGEINFNITKV